METKQLSIITLTIIIITAIIIGSSVYYFKYKADKISSCIEKENQPLVCKCTFRNCYEKDMMVVNNLISK